MVIINFVQRLDNLDTGFVLCTGNLIAKITIVEIFLELTVQFVGKSFVLASLIFSHDALLGKLVFNIFNLCP